MSSILGAELQSVIVANAAALPVNFVNIQGGTFRMGATDIDDDSKPVHEVTVSPFRMGKYPVTVEEYRELVGRLGDNRFALLSGSERRKPKVVALGDSADTLGKVRAQDILDELTEADLLVQGDDRLSSGLKIVEMERTDLDWRFGKPETKPVVVVNWHESVIHALLRGALLATEAQWEYAATCGGRFKYGTASGKLREEEAHYHPHSKGVTAEVGQYPANIWGLHDMTGNVWEWCMDWFEKYSSESQRDPIGPASGEYRVLRGGSWDDDSPDFLRAAFRFSDLPEFRNDYVGFRLVAPQDSPV